MAFSNDFIRKLPFKANRLNLAECDLYEAGLFSVTGVDDLVKYTARIAFNSTWTTNVLLCLYRILSDHFGRLFS